MTAEEILAQAQAAAQDARDVLSMKPQKSQVCHSISSMVRI